jgi:hypothetical protein
VGRPPRARGPVRQESSAVVALAQRQRDHGLRACGDAARTQGQPRTCPILGGRSAPLPGPALTGS